MAEQGITKISVQGFKSLYDKAEVEIRPLTVLAGANSSGKSSIMQPLLLMKQTLESEYDSQALLLNGTLTNFTSTKQFMTGIASKYFDVSPDDVIKQIGYDLDAFVIEIELNDSYSLELLYASETGAFALPLRTKYTYNDGTREYAYGLTHKQIQESLNSAFDEVLKAYEHINNSTLEWSVKLSRGFAQLSLVSPSGKLVTEIDELDLNSLRQTIQEMIYISGFRGHPQRDYPSIKSDFTRFQGRFENYTASIIHYWQNPEKFKGITFPLTFPLSFGETFDNSENEQLLEVLTKQLSELGLTRFIRVESINETQIEVRVGRSMNAAPDDMVSIADVGFGVSQVLPVLVALLVAKAGQLVYIEQPELHLHPRAQVKLAQILADAANRGVRVVVETHSALLLLGIQTLIAEGKLAPEKTILHWFKRDEEGKTTIDSQTPDENGAYGDWDEDFGEVEINAQMRYLNAVSQRQAAMGD